MIELHVAEHTFGMNLSEYALGIWEQFLSYSDTLIGYRKELDLDIVIADVPYRDFDTNTSADPMLSLHEAFERGRVVATRNSSRRKQWITLCGHHSSIIPDRSNPVHYSSLGHESIGALALFEGGVNFVTHDGRIIRSEQWKSAEDYFVELVYKYSLLF